MPSFVTRIELHYSGEVDYDILHKAMQNQGFSRKILGDDGKIYHLPPAEYDIDSPLTQQQVLDKAKAAAATTQKTFSILIAQYTSIMWHNLTEVKK